MIVSLNEQRQQSSVMKFIVMPSVAMLVVVVLFIVLFWVAMMFIVLVWVAMLLIAMARDAAFFFSLGPGCCRSCTMIPLMRMLAELAEHPCPRSFTRADRPLPDAFGELAD